MPRLTRTQKYAGLREQLANDKEEKITTNDLNPYQDRLNNVQDTLSFSTQEVKEKPIFEEVKIEEPEYTWKPFEGDSFSQEVKPIQQPVVEEVKHEDSFFDSFIGEPEEEKHNQDFKSYFENENTNKDVFNDVSDDSGEIVSQKERDTYLNQTLTDVFSYNEQSGEDTINTILDNSIKEVRHPKVSSIPVEEETPAVEAIDNTYWQPFEDNTELDADKLEEEPQINDEEFSNTVSMEITKIMDELANIPKPVVENPVPEVKEEPIIEKPKIEETIQFNETITEEKPEEVVEIKNIIEVEKEEKQKETMSNTIPFVVNTDEEELEDEEEDGSNTVLNVILIVLIVVLVAVLGLIVFYILKTKGIF